MNSGEVISLPPFFQEESTQFSDVDPCLVVPVPFGRDPLDPIDESQHYNLRNYTDPFAYTGYDPGLFQPLHRSYPSLIDQSVIDWFKKEHICCNSTFRFATCEDIPTLTKLSHINSKYNEAEYYKELFSLRNHFLLVVEREDSQGEQVIVGMVHYYFAAIQSKPKGGLNGRDGQVVVKKEPNMEEKVVYISEFQLNQKKNTKRKMKSSTMESEPETSKVLFSLLSEHGRRAGMKWVLVDSNYSAVPYFQQIRGMKVIKRKDKGKYSMQLSILRFDYKLNTNIPANRGTINPTEDASVLKDGELPKCKSKSFHDRNGRFIKAKESKAEETSGCSSQIESNPGAGAGTGTGAGTGAGAGTGTGAGTGAGAGAGTGTGTDAGTDTGTGTGAGTGIKTRSKTRSRNEKTRRFQRIIHYF